MSSNSSAPIIPGLTVQVRPGSSPGVKDLLADFRFQGAYLFMHNGKDTAEIASFLRSCANLVEKAEILPPYPVPGNNNTTFLWASALEHFKTPNSS
jgi:hypothetical protein